MIDRNYLPFKAAREYQDRGMMKWMGFFLSEHTASLYDDRNKVDMSSELSNTEKLILIGQLYAAQLEVIFTVRVKKKKVMHIGKVTELSRKEITIKIADTGKGISQADQEKIFDRFYKADQSRSTPGTGLGLTISQRIVGLHGGTITVESAPEKGSSFFVRLPQ